jgi:hypothetical protein
MRGDSKSDVTLAQGQGAPPDGYQPLAATGSSVYRALRTMDAGESVVDIARTFGVDRATLYRLQSAPAHPIAAVRGNGRGDRDGPPAIALLSTVCAKG